MCSTSSIGCGFDPGLLCDMALYLLSDGVAQLPRRRSTPEIGCAHLLSSQNLLDGAHEESGCLVLAEEIKHELSRPNGGERIRNSFAHDIGRRAVNCLKETWIAPLRVEICTWSQSQAAGKCCSKICEDVAKEIRGDNDIQALRMGDEACGKGVDQLLLVCNVWILGGDMQKYFIPEHHRVLHAVGFGGACDLLAAMLPCILERIAHDPLNALVGKDRRLDRHFILCPLMDASSNTCILSLGILTNADDVNILGMLSGQWTAHSWEQAQRPEIDILVERLANRQYQAPQRNVVRNPRIAYGAKQDAVEASSLKSGESISWHHCPLT